MLLYGMPLSKITELTTDRLRDGHRSPAALAAELRRPHLPAHPSRKTALLALANDLPAAVLGDLLGISITSAPQWTRRATRDRPATSSDRCEGRAGAVGACLWPPSRCCVVRLA
ncbi:MULTISPECIES: hypothetical protein [Streptomyces]|uniref:Uncharacterized protein n=2 Tax=Streptomyces rimosus subsp. rimosus TaxID=132474 RepID=A0A8A1UET9_STRR1|nr:MULTISPECIES: hypothetical protein [Streptomyces]MYT41947.1 hypothetical protein [Streptomyces sp. SID5471]KEF18267.1 hypothetical protein DF18_23810 [Streptomyces rimosus]KOT77568.1 hypothetical protein ADK48_24480 [Streptomyces rimosus subsp. rimosus]QGY66084.1 hypothetical protein V519_009405 [Streptomyces rimosus R6-500]QST79186.1 hypothetical protein SRIM_002510 [Streptomyces rimosus subsp. rimosus ATCC 10970]